MGKIKTRSPLLYAVVSIISALLAINAILIYQNSLSIERNQRLLENAEQAKINSLDVIRNIHLMDLALRGYALTKQEAQRAATDSAKVSHPKIFGRLKAALAAQGFPDLDRLTALEDSVTAYFKLTDKMLVLIAEDKSDEFLKLLRQNEGYNAWLAYRNFSDYVNVFEEKVVVEAEANIQKALRNSYLLQFLIFLMAVPALIYMAYHTARTFRLSDELRVVQIEKNKILQEQNANLDIQVKAKTKDVMDQNEAIKARNAQLILQQEQITLANEIIEAQALQIGAKNRELAQEVEHQTNHLRVANQELIEQNNRLQQFTYIISHNLRAPLARLKGLANLLEYSQNEEEKDTIYRLLVRSSGDIDEVIHDLSSILNIQKQNTMIRSEVSLNTMIHKVLKTLEDEIRDVKATLRLTIGNEKILSIAPYVESILYNLVANAIKYRDPERPLEIDITAYSAKPYICVSVKDNGLGIDLTKHRNNLFNLYKRFHTHVEGKGLGLYLVKTEMDALGGKIEVESEEYKGTQFTLYFNQ